MLEEDKLEALFKNAFVAHKEKVSMEEFESMKHIIARKSFYRFSMHDFNIYYSLAIFSGFLISLILGSHYIYTQMYHANHTVSSPAFNDVSMLNPDSISYESIIYKKQNNTKKQFANENRDDSIHQSFKINKPTTKNESKKADVITIVKAQIFTSKKATTNKIKQPTGGTLQVPDEKTNKQNNTQMIDTLSYLNGLPTTVIDSADTMPKIKSRRKVIIIQKDTIYQVDTIKSHVSKKRKK